jgi:hypothetical protein
MGLTGRDSLGKGAAIADLPTVLTNVCFPAYVGGEGIPSKTLTQWQVGAMLPRDPCAAW